MEVCHLLEQEDGDDVVVIAAVVVVVVVERLIWSSDSHIVECLVGCRPLFRATRLPNDHVRWWASETGRKMTRQHPMSGRIPPICVRTVAAE